MAGGRATEVGGLHSSDRAARIAAHRSPAARPSGRQATGSVAVLPVARNDSCDVRLRAIARLMDRLGAQEGGVTHPVITPVDLQGRSASSSRTSNRANACWTTMT